MRKTYMLQYSLLLFHPEKNLNVNFRLFTSSLSTILASGREVNNSPLAAGVAGARRVDPFEVIQSSVSLTKQQRRRAYDLKRSACIKSPPFKCVPSAVEPQYFNSHSSSFTDCESNFTDNLFLTSCKEGGVIDFNDSIDSVAATDSNSDYNAASDVDTIHFYEKFGVTTSVLSITASTSVSALHKFPARKPFKCSIQNSCRIVLKEILIPTWPTHYSNAYNLSQLSSFNVNGYIFPKSNFIWLCDKIHN